LDFTSLLTEIGYSVAEAAQFQQRRKRDSALTRTFFEIVCQNEAEAFSNPYRWPELWT